MEYGLIFQSALAVAVAVFGFFFKRFSDQLEEGSTRMCALENEIARQKQQANDLEHRLDRIEDKIDRLLMRK